MANFLVSTLMYCDIIGHLERNGTTMEGDNIQNDANSEGQDNNANNKKEEHYSLEKIHHGEHPEKSSLENTELPKNHEELHGSSMGNKNHGEFHNGEGEEEVDLSSPMGWYAIHVSANGENKVAMELRYQFERKNLLHTLGDVLVPKRWTTSLSKGMQVNVEERLIPGYVLVQMHYTHDGAHIIRSIRQVMSILGSDGKGIPKAMSQIEIDQLLSHEGKEPVLQQNLFFQVGETVKIISGIFSSMEGTVEDVDFHKSSLRVSVPIFGRMTPVELTFGQVEKTI